MPIFHPEDATAGGGSSARWAWGRSCTSLPGGPSKGLSFRPSKTDRRLKSPTNVKGQPPGPRIRRESEVVATSGVLVNRREVVGSFDISATLELEVRSNHIPEVLGGLFGVKATTSSGRQNRAGRSRSERRKILFLELNI